MEIPVAKSMIKRLGLEILDTCAPFPRPETSASFRNSELHLKEIVLIALEESEHSTHTPDQLLTKLFVVFLEMCRGNCEFYIEEENKTRKPITI